METENFILASLLTSYPDDFFSEGVRQILSKAEDLHLAQNFRTELEVVVNSENLLLNLQSEFIDIFDRGRVANPLYETEYGRNRAMNKGNELADIAGFYRAFGFEIDSEGQYKDMLDHVAIELEFYALLKMKRQYLQDKNDVQGVEIVTDAQKKFMKDHLGRFVRAIGERPGVKDSQFYSQVFNWVHSVVESECKKLDIDISEAQWIEEAETGSISCGGTVGNLK